MDVSNFHFWNYPESILGIIEWWKFEVCQPARKATLQKKIQCWLKKTQTKVKKKDNLSIKDMFCFSLGWHCSQVCLYLLLYLAPCQFSTNDKIWEHGILTKYTRWITCKVVIVILPLIRKISFYWFDFWTHILYTNSKNSFHNVIHVDIHAHNEIRKKKTLWNVCQINIAVTK